MQKLKKVFSLLIAVMFVFSMLPMAALGYAPEDEGGQSGGGLVLVGGEDDEGWDDEYDGELPDVDVSMIAPTALSAADFAGGDGLTSGTAYQIATVDQLKQLCGSHQNLGLTSSTYFKLMNDLTITDNTWEGIGNYYYNFEGNFDGNGKIITFDPQNGTGVEFYSIVDNSYGGFFYEIGEDATVKNLVIKSTKPMTHSFDLVEEADVGIFVGSNYGGTIENCGVIAPSITNTYHTSANGSTGGFVGINYEGTINNCYAQVGSVISTAACSDDATGGFVGHNEDGTITNCYTTATTVTGYATGGFVGENQGTIANTCWYDSSVTSASQGAQGLETSAFTAGALLNYLTNPANRGTGLAWLADPITSYPVHDFTSLSSSLTATNNTTLQTHLEAASDDDIVLSNDITLSAQLSATLGGNKTIKGAKTISGASSNLALAMNGKTLTWTEATYNCQQNFQLTGAGTFILNSGSIAGSGSFTNLAVGGTVSAQINGGNVNYLVLSGASSSASLNLAAATVSTIEFQSNSLFTTTGLYTGNNITARIYNRTEGTTLISCDSAANATALFAKLTWEGTPAGLEAYVDGSNIKLRSSLSSTVYVNGTTGDDSKDGSSVANAVKTLGAVYSKVSTGGTICVLSSLDIGGAVTISKNVTIESRKADGSALGATDTPWTIRALTGTYATNSAVFSITGGTTILSNITIDANAKGSVFYLTNCNLTINNGTTITGGYGTEAGGIVTTSNGTITMNGGIITGNTATGNTSAGGVRIASAGGTSFIMNGGVITGNTGNGAGSVGGVHIEGGTFTLGNTAPVIITGNIGNGAVNNVNLKSGTTITIASALTSGSYIGVTTATIPSDGNAVNVATGAGAAASLDFFVMDKAVPFVMLQSATNLIKLQNTKPRPVYGRTQALIKEVTSAHVDVIVHVTGMNATGMGTIADPTFSGAATSGALQDTIVDRVSTNGSYYAVYRFTTYTPGTLTVKPKTANYDAPTVNITLPAKVVAGSVAGTYKGATSSMQYKINNTSNRIEMYAENGTLKTTYANYGWKPDFFRTSGLTQWYTANAVPGTDFVDVSFYMYNPTNAAISNAAVSLYADVMIGNNDRAPVNPYPTIGSYGFQMKQSDATDAATLTLINMNKDRYANETAPNQWTSYSVGGHTGGALLDSAVESTTALSGVDSVAVARVRNITVPAGELYKYSIYIGAGGLDVITTQISNAILPVAMIGNNRYNSLQDAINAARPGDTITLNKDMPNEIITVTSSITIQSPTGSNYKVGGFLVYGENTNLTLNNVSLQNAGDNITLYQGSQVTLGASVSNARVYIDGPGSKVNVTSTSPVSITASTNVQVGQTLASGSGSGTVSLSNYPAYDLKTSGNNKIYAKKVTMTFGATVLNPYVTGTETFGNTIPATSDPKKVWVISGTTAKINSSDRIPTVNTTFAELETKEAYPIRLTVATTNNGVEAGTYYFAKPLVTINDTAMYKDDTAYNPPTTPGPKLIDVLLAARTAQGGSGTTLSLTGDITAADLTALLGTASPLTINGPGSIIDNIALSGTQSLILNGVDVIGNVTVGSGCTLTAGGGSNISGSVTVESGGTANLNSGSAGSVINNGTLTMSGADFDVNGAVTLESGTSINLTNPVVAPDRLAVTLVGTHTDNAAIVTGTGAEGSYGSVYVTNSDVAVNKGSDSLTITKAPIVAMIEGANGKVYEFTSLADAVTYANANGNPNIYLVKSFTIPDSTPIPSAKIYSGKRAADGTIELKGSNPIVVTIGSATFTSIADGSAKLNYSDVIDAYVASLGLDPSVYSAANWGTITSAISTAKTAAGTYDNLTTALGTLETAIETTPALSSVTFTADVGRDGNASITIAAEPGVLYAVVNKTGDVVVTPSTGGTAAGDEAATGWYVGGSSGTITFSPLPVGGEYTLVSVDPSKPAPFPNDKTQTPQSYVTDSGIGVTVPAVGDNVYAPNATTIVIDPATDDVYYALTNSAGVVQQVVQAVNGVASFTSLNADTGYKIAVVDDGNANGNISTNNTLVSVTTPKAGFTAPLESNIKREAGTGAAVGTDKITITGAITGQEYGLVNERNGTVEWITAASGTVTFNDLDPSVTYSVVTRTPDATSPSLATKPIAVTPLVTVGVDKAGQGTVTLGTSGDYKYAVVDGNGNLISGVKAYDENGVEIILADGWADHSGNITFKPLPVGGEYTIIKESKTADPATTLGITGGAGAPLIPDGVTIGVPAVGDNLSAGVNDNGNAYVTIDPATTGKWYAAVDEDGNAAWKQAGADGKVNFNNLATKTSYTIVTSGTEGNNPVANTSLYPGAVEITTPPAKLDGSDVVRKADSSNAGKEVITISNIDPTYEYAVVPKGTALSEVADSEWKNSANVANGVLTFDNLAPTGDYEVLVRLKNGDGIALPSVTESNHFSGKLQLTGTVKDSGGNPVGAGIVVKVAVNTPSGPKTLSATTNSQGIYTITAEPVLLGAYTLYVEGGNGKGIYSDAFTIGGQPQNTNITLGAANTSSFGGIVTMPDGTPVTSGTVTVKNMSTGTTSSITTLSDAGGYVVNGLADGTYTVSTSDTGVSASTQIVIASGKVTPATVNLNMSTGAIISGRVSELSDGESVTVKITVPAYAADGTVIGSKTLTSTATGTGGYYQFSPVIDGSYTVTLTDSNGNAGTKAITVSGGSITGGGTIAKSVIDTVATKTSLSGILVDTDGKPVAGATIKLYNTDGTPTSIVASVTTGAGGGYTLLLPDDVTLLSNGIYYISADTGGSSSNALAGPVQIGTDANNGKRTITGKTNITIDTAVQGKLLAGSAKNPDGTPASGATVVVTDSSGKVIGTATTDANGNYLIPNVPDSAIVSIVTKDGKSVKATVTANGGNLITSPATLTPVMPGSQYLTVIGPDGAILPLKTGSASSTEAQVSISPVGTGSISVLDGKLDVSAVAPNGTYTVTVTKDGMSVTTPISVSNGAISGSNNVFKIGTTSVTGNVVYDGSNLAPSGAEVTISSVAKEWGTATAKANGSYVITGIPAGTYTETIKVKDDNGTTIATITNSITVGSNGVESRTNSKTPDGSYDITMDGKNVKVGPSAVAATAISKLNGVQTADTAGAITAIKDALAAYSALSVEEKRQVSSTLVKNASENLIKAIRANRANNNALAIGTGATGVQNTSVVATALESQKALLLNSNEIDKAADDQSGVNVLVDLKLVAQEVTEDPNSGDMNKLEAVATVREAEVGAVFDISIVKTTTMSSDSTNETVTKELVTEVPQMIEITLGIPSTAQNFKYYAVALVHNGVTKILPCAVSGINITFQTRQFSTYALLVSDEPIFDGAEVTEDNSGSGGGNGGGGSITSVSNASIASTTGGTVSITPSNPKPGDKVTITVTPDNGYICGGVTVTDKDGKIVTVVKESENVYTFIMPESMPVTITPTFNLANAGGIAEGVADMLNVVDHFAYIQGKSAGIFTPDANLTRAEAALIFYRLLKNQDVDTSDVSFSDVPDGTWYTEAVRTLAAIGIISGYTDGSFRPNASIKRDEFVAMATRFTVLLSGTHSFSDVSHYWATENIITAVQLGWIGGYPDGTFRPSETIKRAEAVKVINRMLGRIPDKSGIDEIKGIAIFSDVSSNHWAFYEIAEASNSHGYEITDAGIEVWTREN